MMICPFNKASIVILCFGYFAKKLMVSPHQKVGGPGSAMVNPAIFGRILASSFANQYMSLDSEVNQYPFEDIQVLWNQLLSATELLGNMSELFFSQSFAVSRPKLPITNHLTFLS
jgi:hypothetical protein